MFPWHAAQLIPTSGLPKRERGSISFLFEWGIIHVLLYGNVCLLWILFSSPEERTGVRLWAHTTVGCSGLSWPRPAGRGTSEILSWTHPKWSITVPTWGSDSLEPESSSSRQRHFVLDINVLDFMILLPRGHAKHVGITVRTMKSGGRCFLVLLKVILKKWHDLVIRSISKPQVWRKSRLKWTQDVSTAVKKGQGQAAQEPRGLLRF